MTVLRWILWLSVGGVAVWLFERFFGGAGLPEGIVTPGMLGAPAGEQAGTRGTGVASDALVSSWRTTFTGVGEEHAAMNQWRDDFLGGLVTPEPEPGTTTLTKFITLGEFCSPEGAQGITVGGQRAVCYRSGFGAAKWTRLT